MMAQPSKDKLWTSTFILLTVVQTMDLLTFHTITPVIAKFTIQQGAALAASGLAASVFSFASMFARPLSGLIADKLGRRPIILTAIAVSVAMQLGYALTPGFAPLFFMANSLALLVTRPAIGKISDKYGLAKLILPAIVIETIALLGICFARELWLFLAAGIFKAFGSGGVLPSIQAECGRLESKERSGVAMSTYLLGSDIGYAVGPLLGGLLASAVGYDLLLFGTLPITALAFAIYAIWHACTQK